MSDQSEAGTTLVEVLLTVVILGLAAAALLGGIGVGILSTGLDRQQADAGTVLAGAGEAVKDQVRNPFVPCASAASYNPTRGVALPSGWSAADVTIAGQIGSWDGTQFQTASCSDLAVAPPAPTLTVQGAGGGLGSGSYTYRLVYDNGLGGTLPGPEATPVSVSTGTANQVTVAWPAAPSGVTAVSVYGRAAGAEKLLGTVTVLSTATPGSFTDKGTVAPAGAVPPPSGSLQLITVTVTTPDGRATQSRTFVKRGV